MALTERQQKFLQGRIDSGIWTNVSAEQYEAQLSGSGREYVPGVGFVDANTIEGAGTVTGETTGGVSGGANGNGALGSAGGVSRSSAMVNKQANNDAVPVMYGLQRMGGTRIFLAASDGQGNEQTTDQSGNVINTSHLNMVLSIAEGEMGSIKQVYFNEGLVWDVDTGGGFATGRGAADGEELINFEAPYNSVSGLRIFYYPGIQSPNYCQELESSISTWGPDGQGGSPDMNELAYLALIMPADEVFGGQLPTVTVVLEGKTILDVSTLTNGAPDPSWTYQDGEDQNPVDVLYDYLTSDKYGKGLDRLVSIGGGGLITSVRNVGKDLDLASFQQARLDVDAARTGNGYPFNGFISTNNKMYDNVLNILGMMNGMLLFINGKYHLKIRQKDEHLNLPDYKIFDKDDILSAISVVFPSKQTKLNKATGIYGGSGTDWNDDMVIYSPASYLTADNGTVLENKQDFGLITDEQFVLDMITQRVDYSRVSQSISFTASHRAMELTTGDVIEVRNDQYGWGTGAGQTQKFWRISSLTTNPDNTVEISASTYDSSKEL